MSRKKQPKLPNRGISTLIVTVLLIAMSIILGALGMSFGGSFTENIQDNNAVVDQRLTCTFDVEVLITDACYTLTDTNNDGKMEGTVTLLIENTKSTDLSSELFLYRLYQGDSIILAPGGKNTKLKGGEITRLKFPFNPDNGELTSVAVIPTISRKNEKILCLDHVTPQPISTC